MGKLTYWKHESGPIIASMGKNAAWWRWHAIDQVWVIAGMTDDLGPDQYLQNGWTRCKNPHPQGVEPGKAKMKKKAKSKKKPATVKKVSKPLGADLPQDLYAHWDGHIGPETESERWLCAYNDVEDAASSLGNAVASEVIGVYKLVKVCRVKPSTPVLEEVV